LFIHFGFRSIEAYTAQGKTVYTISRIVLFKISLAFFGAPITKVAHRNAGERRVPISIVFQFQSRDSFGSSKMAKVSSTLFSFFAHLLYQRPCVKKKVTVIFFWRYRRYRVNTEYPRLASGNCSVLSPTRRFKPI
jgi:hypothetical protein